MSETISSRRWKKFNHKRPAGILFLDYAFGDPYSPHYHGVGWIHKDAVKRLDDPLVRYHLDKHFQSLSEMCVEFHIQKVTYHTPYVMAYACKKLPYLPVSDLNNGHEMILLPES
jgi:hypothetical protein